MIKEAIDNVEKSRKMLHNLKSTTTPKIKIIKEKIPIEEFSSIEEWKAHRILEPKCGILNFLKKRKKRVL